MNRRDFTRLTAAGTAALGFSQTIITGSGWKGANDRVNISYRLGRSLEFDPFKMKFINAPDADALLTRQYREPFVLPEKI
jgi:hypothetical protein